MKEKKYNITDQFDEKLGTIGGGNHFIELFKVNNAKNFNHDKDKLYLCVHSGSRDFGVYIQSLFNKEIIHKDDDEFAKFMELHDEGVELGQS